VGLAWPEGLQPAFTVLLFRGLQRLRDGSGLQMAPHWKTNAMLF